MYGLFEMTHEFYRFEKLICVSKNKSSLKKYFNKTRTIEQRKDFPLISAKKSENEFFDDHFVIIKIKEV